MVPGSPSFERRKSTGQFNDPGHFTAVSCAGVGDDLHLVALDRGRRHVAHHQPRLTAPGSPSFGVRAGAKKSNDPGHFTAVSCAGVGDDLHLVALTADGGMWHTSRHPDGSWEPSFEDVKARQSNDPGYFTAVSCAGVGDDLHLVALTADGGMWHTSRHPDGSWEPSFKDVKARQSNDPGYFTAVSCAGVGDDLHLVALTADGGMWHTISGPDAWQPSFGDVKGQESNDPGCFTAVGCEGAG